MTQTRSRCLNNHAVCVHSLYMCPPCRRRGDQREGGHDWRPGDESRADATHAGNQTPSSTPSSRPRPGQLASSRPCSRYVPVCLEHRALRYSKPCGGRQPRTANKPCSAPGTAQQQRPEGLYMTRVCCVLQSLCTADGLLVAALLLT